MIRHDLTRLPIVRSALRSRFPQLMLTIAALLGFLLAIVSGWFGTPVGSRNFGIIFVWIVWWAVLMFAAVPLFGRGWCSICPIPIPGEWLQRGSILGPLEKSGIGLGKRWPKKLRGMWIQNGAFILLALFSTAVLTKPQVTAGILAALLFLAIGISLIFERRSFCRYLCPVGGFIGLYSQLAPLEVRVKDAAICTGHTQKTCYTGNADGYGCPWGIFPPTQIRNSYCGTCMECLRTCPYQNIAVQIRPFGADLAQNRGRRMDEAYKGFIMLGSALIYALVLLGPWGQLKLAAYSIGSRPWLVYALSFLFFVSVILPGLFGLSVLAGKHLAKTPLQLSNSVVHFSSALIPLGMAAWIAFSLSFLLSNISYIWGVLSDPFGWGWDLFGTASLAWTPYLTQVAPFLQAGILLSGLVWAAFTVHNLAGQVCSGKAAVFQSLPVVLFCLGFTLAMLGALVS